METFQQMWEGILAFGVVSVALGVFCGALSKLYKALQRIEQNEKRIADNTEFRIESKSRMDLLTESAKVNHRVNLYRLCEDALKKGYCSQDRRRVIESANEVYHSLGGNGDVKDMIQKARALPLEPEE